MGNQTYKGPGVIESIKEFLFQASEAVPITKDEILRKLVSRFPDRPADSMMATVKQQVPHKLTVDAGFRVQKNKHGYWLTQTAAVDGENSSVPQSQGHVPQTIRIDAEVWQGLQKIAVPFVDTPNDVLRRLLGL
jgi:hypothetical protein